MLCLNAVTVLYNEWDLFACFFKLNTCCTHCVTWFHHLIIFVLWCSKSPWRCSIAKYVGQTVSVQTIKSLNENVTLVSHKVSNYETPQLHNTQILSVRPHCDLTSARTVPKLTTKMDQSILDTFAYIGVTVWNLSKCYLLIMLHMSRSLLFLHLFLFPGVQKSDDINKSHCITLRNVPSFR